jgi:hypothetical protein
LRKDIRERFGLDLPLVRARSVVQSENVIVIGVIGDTDDAGQAVRNTLLARLQARERIGPPPARPEGYRVSVSPRPCSWPGATSAARFGACKRCASCLFPIQAANPA